MQCQLTSQHQTRVHSEAATPERGVVRGREQREEREEEDEYGVEEAQAHLIRS